MNTNLAIIMLVVVLAAVVFRSRQFQGAVKGMSSSAPVTGSSVVRELGQATLFVHQREEEGVSAHMIVWRPVESDGLRVQDAHVALCMFPGGRIEHQMIEDALALAREQLAVRNVPLDVLAVASPSAKCVPGDTQQSPPEASVAATAVAHVKNPGECRGTIMQMGNMPRVLPDKKITMYGVRCMGDDGVETTIWGVNLRTKLKDVGAGVGDRVEIVKKGSKVMEEGKAPMTVFEVRKL